MTSGFFQNGDMDFHPVMHLPPDAVVFDFTRGYDEASVIEAGFGIGRYNEPRPHGMYVSDIYEPGRNIHMGIDLWAPEGTAVFAVCEGQIYATAIHGNPRDYGPTIITQHLLGDRELFILHGHLATESVGAWSPGDAISRGQEIGRLGSFDENGGWPPHLHLQLGVQRPSGANMPGVVRSDQRQFALERHPDPRLVLGPIY